MSSSQHHIIRRQYLHVELDGTEADGLSLQRTLPELCEGPLLNTLDKVLGKSVPVDEHWLIDSLEIDAGAFSLENFERDFLGEVAEKIEKSLRERTTSAAFAREGPALRRRSESRSILDAFVHFLQSGTLPWWFHRPGDQNLERLVLAALESGDLSNSTGRADFSWSVLSAVRSGGALTRLAHQFSPAFVGILLEKTVPDRSSGARAFMKDLERFDSKPAASRLFVGHVWRGILADVARSGHTPVTALIRRAWNAMPNEERRSATVREQIDRIWPGALNDSMNDDRGALGTDRSEPTRSGGDAVLDAELAEGLYVSCAGMTLLHPFLPRLFQRLGVASEDRILQPMRAMALLHFLATGVHEPREYELTVPKLLCGVPLDQPLESLFELTKQDERESVDLLQAVIQHWDALGNTSVDGLRGTFLTRDGKLSRSDDGDWLLHVESRSFDVLMERLPWDIGTIKLPWMENIVWVQWK